MAVLLKSRQFSETGTCNR